MQLEFHQLERKYGALRITDPARQARLVTSLAEHGQQHAVFVVRAVEVDGRYILIDGYRRVAALERLGHDVVDALVLDMSEAEALIFAHRLEHQRPRSSMEEGWLVRELCEGQGKSQREVAVAFGRSTSWVSRRLALVRDLPEGVQEAVRRGVVCAHAAMKYLVVLARANREHCQRLVENLRGHRLSERDLCRLYVAWRAGNRSQREKIVGDPLVHLRVEQEQAAAAAPPDPGAEREHALVRDLGVVAGACRRARQSLKDRARREKTMPWPSLLRLAWQEAQASFGALTEVVCEEIKDA